MAGRYRALRGPWAYALFVAVLIPAGNLKAQPYRTVEDFEFASTDENAGAGVIDLTDPPNRPTFYLSGDINEIPPEATHGQYSIGTDLVFCINPLFECVPGTFVGFRRYLDPERPDGFCPNAQPFLALRNTYGDPNNPGPIEPDYPLSELRVLCDLYGDGGFADGATGAHLWVVFVDCEGEKFQFINFSEEALYSEFFTLDVAMGRSIVRLAPESLHEVPDGNRLLTEIAAVEVLIQDTDDPPDAVGKWYIDFLKIEEPGNFIPGDFDGDNDVDIVDFSTFTGCFAGAGAEPPLGCEPADFDGDRDVDIVDFSTFATNFTGAR